MTTVEELYKHFGVLADAKDRAGEYEKEYLAILEAVKGGPSEKRLASQFIARFFKYFPGCAEKALDAQFDLCEDEDVNIRKQAIKDLPALCRESTDHLPRISDVLTQLLQTDDPTELSLVQTALMALLRAHPKGALGGLFSQILQGEDIVRERGIKFLRDKLGTLDSESWTKDVEDFLILEIKKVLQDVTGAEFMAFMNILSSLKTMTTMQGRQQLVEIVAEQADLDQQFVAGDPDSVDRLVQCVKQVASLFSKNVHSDRFLVYVLDKVLPVLSEVQGPEEEEEGGVAAPSDAQLEVLKILADMSLHCGELERSEERTEVVFARLLEYMPQPPSEENAENTNFAVEPKIQFSHVECLMYTFHQLARRCPQVLTGDEHAARLKDFRVRLQYLARGVQVYIKQLKMALQGKTGDALKTDENKIKVVALRTTNNINTLIKDLFHNPPAYKASVSLSFKRLGGGASQNDSSDKGKRPGITPISFPSDGSSPPKKPKPSSSDRRLYSPPSGKFSEKAGPFTGPQGRGQVARGGGGGRGGPQRGRGGFRGRGGGNRGYRQW